MKTCGTCKESLPVENFRWKNEAKGWRQSNCIECNKAYQREHYKNNKSVYKDKRKIWHDAQYERVMDYLNKNPCVDCGEDNIVCLEFDHRDRLDKTISISEAIRGSWSWSRIQEEIDKCDVRCRNCHAKVTAKQFGWRKAISI